MVEVLKMHLFFLRKIIWSCLWCTWCDLSKVLYHFQMGYLAKSLVVLLAMLKFTDVVLPPYTPVRSDSQIRSGGLVMSSKTLRCSGLIIGCHEISLQLLSQLFLNYLCICLHFDTDYEGPEPLIWDKHCKIKVRFLTSLSQDSNEDFKRQSVFLVFLYFFIFYCIFHVCVGIFIIGVCM